VLVLISSERANSSRTFMFNPLRIRGKECSAQFS
jgi:hypothetical protein